MLLLMLGTFAVVSSGIRPARADEVVATIPLNYGVDQIAVNPNTNMVYATDNGGDVVSVINGSTNLVATTITLPHSGGNLGPSSIAVDPSTDKAYVILGPYSNSEYIDVINTTTNSFSKTIQLPDEGQGMAPLAVAVNSMTDMVYITSGYIAAGVGPSNGNLFVVDGSTGTVVSTLNVPDVPFGVAVDESTNMVYVTDAPYAGSTASQVTVVDGSTNAIATTIPIPNDPLAVAVDPSTDMVYVGEQTGASVAVIDGSTNTLVTQVDVGSFPSGVAVNPSTDTVYVDNAKNNSVSVINGASNQVVTTIPVGVSPSGVGVDPDSDLIYVPSSTAPNSFGNNPAGEVSVIQGGSPGSTSFLTVVSQSTNGSAITKVGVSLSINGRVAVTGATPDTFALNDGQSAIVQMNNGYQNCAFDRWADTGSTSSSRTITISGNTRITAVYSCNEKVVSWKTTNGFSESQYSPGDSCPTYGSVIYCVGGYDYYSTMSSAGFGTWSATTPYPTSLDAGGSGIVISSACVISSGYIYCVGGYGQGSGAHATNAVEYAPVSNAGIGAWTGTTPYPVEVSGAQCLTSQGYIYCVDGSSTYYVPILASGGLGTWAQTTSYPSGISGENCVTSLNDAYCIAGSTNSTYYATLSSSGIGPWSATTNYTGWGQNGVVCTTGDSIVYCVGDGTLGGVWYAPLSASGIGSWSRTTSYPTGTPLSCAVEGSYIYCVDASGLPSYFSLISSSVPTVLLTVTSQGTSGNPLPGYEAVLNQSGTVIIARAYTPAIFNLTQGQSYTVGVDGFDSCTFDRWLDTGNTTAIRQISVTANTQITAVMSCNETIGSSTMSTTSSSSSSPSSSSTVSTSSASSSSQPSISTSSSVSKSQTATTSIANVSSSSLRTLVSSSLSTSSSDTYNGSTMGATTATSSSNSGAMQSSLLPVGVLAIAIPVIVIGAAALLMRVRQFAPKSVPQR